MEKRTLPLYTTNEEIIAQRKQKYLKEIEKSYKNLPRLTKEEYCDIKTKFNNEDSKVLETLMGKSLHFIVDVVANLYAKYELEDILPLEEGLSNAIYNFNYNLNKFTELPDSYSAYTNNIINFYVFYDFVNYKTVNDKKNKRGTTDLYPDVTRLIDERESYDPKRELIRKEFINDFICASKTLSPREKEVLFLKLGLENDEEMSLKDIAKKLGVTISNVGAMYKRALKKLREPYAASFLSKYKNHDMSV